MYSLKALPPHDFGHGMSDKAYLPLNWKRVLASKLCVEISILGRKLAQEYRAIEQARAARIHPLY
jgi:hypothetical protein